MGVESKCLKILARFTTTYCESVFVALRNDGIALLNYAEVIRMRQENEKAKTAAAAVGNSAHQKTAPSRTSKKEKVSLPACV